MSVTADGKPYIIHALPGRMRAHVPAWSGHGPYQVEQHVRKVPGVKRVEASYLTRNVLIGFDPQTTDEATLLAVLQTAPWRAGAPSRAR